MTNMNSKTIKGVEGDFNTVKNQIGFEFEKAKAKLSKVQQHAESYIAKNPKRATAMAVGVGAAIGAAITAYLMKKRNEDSRPAKPHYE